MKKVIDSNYLSSPKLYDFLSQSKKNTAVLTEYVAIEAYKGEKLESICESMEMLSYFRNQVDVVKNTIAICKIDF